MNIRHLLVILLAAFAFFMSAYISSATFERLPHLEDEFAYLYQARIFAGGHIVIDSPEPSNSFWQPFVLDHNGNRFGKYTIGWPLVLAIGTLLGQMWVMNAFFSMLTVALVYRFGSRIFNPDVGLFAALLTAFSPAALLLNASLMGHSVALFWTTLFMYAYWRIEQTNHWRWGLLAGIALGLLTISRPLTSVAIALPFVVWSGARLINALSEKRLLPTLRPLLVLGTVAVMFAIIVPLFNYVATGSPTLNPYTLVWEYDRIGFGECCGRTAPGHMLQKAFNHVRYDLSLTASDLFGWQLSPITPELTEHLQDDATTYPASGFSFILLPFGVFAGLFYQFRQRRKAVIKQPVSYSFFLIWVLLVAFWVALPQREDLLGVFGFSDQILLNPTFSYLWVFAALALILLPLFYFIRTQETASYTWLMLSIVASIIIVQMLYWVGSQRYSTRYYYEALTAATLLSALPLAWLAQRIRWSVVFAGMTLLGVVVLFHYSLPRINVLYRFNQISPVQIEAVQAEREGDNQLLVIVTGSTSGDDRVRWRAYAALLAVTSPYLDSDIVAARDYGTSGMRDAILAQFPARQVVNIHAFGNDYTILDE